MAIITGNNQDNLIEGTVADDIILAGGGDDTVNAGGGNDLVFAGDGDDTVNAGDGNDLVFAGKGDDTVDGGDGDDLIFAEGGDDTIDGGEGNDIVFAGKGDDTVIHLEADNLDSENWYFGEAGTDTLRLVVSLETFNSDDFQQELAAFQAMIDAGGSASGSFTTLGIHFSSFENIEVVPDNLPPTSISLSNASVLENSPGGVIGTLSAIDPNGAAGLTFSLAEGSEFLYEIVDGTTLKLLDNVSLDREGFFSPPPAVVTVTDPGGLTHTQEFAIEVLDVDEPPQTPIPFFPESAASVAENTPGAVFFSFGARDPEGGALTFEVSDDRFEVVQNSGTSYSLKLKDGISLDYETDPDVAVTVTITDPGGLATSRIFNVAVQDGAPTGIALDNATVDENAVGAEIGNLTVTDPDGDTEFNISVDDSRFEVVDGVLKLADGESLDFETEPTVSVAVTAASVESSFSSFIEFFEITVGDVNEAPTAIALDNTSIDENDPGAVVGAVTVTDPDGDIDFDFDLSDDRFEVADGMLKLKDGESLDFEGEQTVAVDVTATDSGGLAVTETFDIQVEDIEEAPQIVRPTGVEGTLIMIALTTFDPGLAPILTDPGAENSLGAAFGILSASDPDGEPLTVELSDSRFEAVQITEFVTPGTEIPPELEPILSTIYVVKLLDGEAIDHEDEPNVSLTATATDAAGLMASTSFDVAVVDVNEAPTAIALDNNPIDENELGAIVGAVTVTDPDGDIAFDFDLSDDRFEVADGMLKLKNDESLDFEDEPQVTLDITAIDPLGLSHTEMFVIQVADVDGLLM